MSLVEAPIQNNPEYIPSEGYLPGITTEPVFSEGGLGVPKVGILTQQERQSRGLAKGDVIADIVVGENSFAPKAMFSIVEVDLPDTNRDGELNRKILLLGLSTSKDGQPYYERGKLVDITDQLHKDKEITIGQEEGNILGLTQNTQGKLKIASVHAGQSLFVEHDGGKEYYCDVAAKHFPKHNSVEPEHEIDPPEHDVREDYTLSADEASKLREFKRPQIGRDRRIEGGVYTTASNDGKTILGEVIVVDDKYDKEFLDKYVENIISKITKGMSDVEVARIAFGEVHDTIKYSLDGVKDIVENTRIFNNKQSSDGMKMQLATFMEHRIGVCRHQALILGRIMERLVDEGIISGHVSVDRNKNWNPLEGEYNGHAWVRYTPSQSDILILDIAQNYFGTLNNSASTAQWHYFRKSDKIQQIAKHSLNSLQS